MRLGVLSVVVALATVVAHADSRLKSPPPETPVEAMRAIFAAELAVRDRDYDRALALYDTADSAAPTPEAAFNRAIVLELAWGKGWARRASAAYDEYLKRAPDAKDRAVVEKLRSRYAGLAVFVRRNAWRVGLGAGKHSMYSIEKHPIDDVESLIVIDGKLAGPAPGTAPFGGRHDMERITASTYAIFLVDGYADPLVRLLNWKPNPGNVLVRLAGTWEARTFPAGGRSVQVNERMKLDPGKYTIAPKGACKPFDIVVKRDVLTYVYVRATKGAGKDECSQLSTETSYFPIPRKAQ